MYLVKYQDVNQLYNHSFILGKTRLWKHVVSEKFYSPHNHNSIDFQNQTAQMRIIKKYILYFFIILI